MVLAAQPYRTSWLPFGPARRTAVPGEAPGGGTSRPRPARISMTPIQIGGMAYRAASPRATAPVRAMAPAPVVRMPRMAQQSLGYAMPSPPPPPARTYAATSTPTRTTRAPSRRSFVPRSRALAPALPRGVSSTAPSSQPSVISGRTPAPGQPGAARPVSLDVIAVLAIVLTFVLPPIALLVAVSALRRAIKNRTPTALAWVSLLVAGVGTLIFLGFGSLLVQAFQSAAG